MKIFRTALGTARPTEEEEASKVVIFVPPPDEDMIRVPCGVLHFAGEQIQVSVIDPRGVEWDPFGSIEVLAETIKDFLASKDEWLQLVTPTNGEPLLMTRELVTRVITIESAMAQQRKEFQRPAPPNGIRVVHGVPPELIRGHGPGKR